MKKTLFTLFLVLAGACTSLTAATAQSASSLQYKGYLRGVHALALDFNYADNAQNYQITSDLQTVGLASLALKRHLADQAVGTVGPQGLSTSEYIHRDQIKGAANGIIGGQAQVKNPGAALIVKPIPGQAANFLDPMSAIGHALWMGSTQGGCSGTRTLYDGRVLGLATYSTLGQETLATNGQQRVGGQTLKCRVRIQSLENRKIDVPQVDIWMGALKPGNLYLPLKMSWWIDNEVVTFHLQNYR